jgi:hypothetical protein
LLDGCEDWIRKHVAVQGRIELSHERPWSTVLRIPLSSGYAWFKACQPVQAFEPRLSARLFERWPDRVGEVLAYDEARAWLLLVDAGEPLSASGNRPDVWLSALPRYAELQRGETAFVADHLAHGVPDLGCAMLPARYRQLVQSELPIASDEIAHLQRFGSQFSRLCSDLGERGIADSIQHDDLHAWNLYSRDSGWRVLDWGDTSISHPFMSLVVTFRFLEESNRLLPTDRWFARLRDAYLEPWGPGLQDTFALAMRIGALAHPLVELRHRAAIAPSERGAFDDSMRTWLQRAVAQVNGAGYG